MAKLLLAFGLAIAAFAPVAVSAQYYPPPQRQYELYFTNYSPYYTEPVAGPFDSLQACMSAEAQATYVSGGSYSCRMI